MNLSSTMASQRKQIFSKNSDTVPEVFDILINLFGDVLHVDVIKSVALNCNWKLEAASNILAELTASVSNDTITSKKSKNSSSNINSVGYAAAGDDDNNVDVYIEGDKDQDKNKFNYKQAILEGNKCKVNNPKKGSPVKQIQPKPVQPKSIQNKSKRELEYDRVREHILTGAKVCILLRGLPGSGKTHLSRIIVQTTISEDYHRFIFSTDEYFQRNDVYNYNPALLSDAHFWNQKRVYEAMHLGISPVIVDNTNTQMWEMKPYATNAVQFGYAVEILEPMTVWIFNPPELARRNIHNVPKNKIADMLDRYEKNITPEKLFSMFALKYSPRNHPPQPRLYPPLSKNIKPLCSIPASIAKNPNNMSNKNENQPKPKRKRPKKKKQDGQSSDSASTLSKSESMQSILTNDDSDSDIDSLNELKKTDSGYSLNVRDAFYDKGDTNVKQINQYELVNLDDNTQQKNYNKQNAENIDLINFDFEDNNKITYSSDLIGLGNNKTENSTVSASQEKTQQLIDSCVKLFNAVTNKDKTIDKNLSSSTEYPKIDLSSWGLTDDAFISWELVDKPKIKEETKQGPQLQRQTVRQISRESSLNPNEIGTNTSSEDFALLKKDIVNNSDIKIIPANSRNIGENCSNPVLRNPTRVSMFDKSTMTGRESVLNAALSRNRCNNEAHHFTELLKLFPNVREDVLKDIFEKCRGDVNWTVDLLLDGNKETNLGNSEQVLDVASNHVHTLDCNCSTDYEPEVYIREEYINESPNLHPEYKKSPTKIKNRVSEESLLLKKQLEEQFKIDDTYYSSHVSNIRKKRYGEQEPIPSTSNEQQPSTSFEEVTQNHNEEFESSEESSEEEIIEMNVGLDFIAQLEKTSGNPDLDYPRGFQPVMQLPASLVRLLHAYWLESVYQQMDNQSIILENMLKEDEDLARKLQEQEAIQQNGSPVVPNLQEIMDMEIALAIYKADQEQWKKETPDDLASRMKRQKLFETFPNFDQGALIEIMQACNNSFDQTVEVLKASIDPDHATNKSSTVELAKQTELIENAKKEYIQAKQIEKKLPKIVVKDENTEEDNGACCAPQKTPTQYREEAAHHLKMRQTCLVKAQEAIQKGLTQVASYYSGICQMHKQRYEQANNLAASAFLSAHSKIQNSRTLDLHYLYVKEAKEALDMFIDKHVSMLKARNKPTVTLFVITGRGSHSKDGISHIKPVVKRHLKDRNLNFIQMNPGFLKVTVNKHSIMTNDLK